MVTDAILDAMFAVFETILGLLPDYTPSAHDGASAFTTIVNGWQAFSNWLNMTALFGVFALWLVLELAVGATKALTWVYDRIPFKAT